MEGDPDWEPSPEDEEALYEEAAAAYGEESLARLSPTPPQSPPLKRTKLGNTQEEEEQPGAHACGTCGHPCVVRMSLTQKNPNRKFYKCEACGYFKWADEASSSSPRSKNHGSAPVPSSPQQQISGGDAHACGTCGQPCVLRTSLTQKNPNRRFYKCDPCSYFKWADEADVSSSPRSKNHGSAPVPSSPQQQISGDDAHACGTCGQPCIVRASLTQKNPNRKCYKCEACGYFKWADEAPSSSPRSKNHGSSPVPSSPQQQISGGDAHACGTCGQPCVVHTSLTQKNPNRKFYKCEACGYFKWADEAPSSSPRTKNHGSSPVPSSPQQQISGGDAHACGSCGQPCVVHMSFTQKNPNRRFYKCDPCSYFKWADEAPSSAPPKNYGGTPAPPVTDRSGVCFKCNKPGHFARDCPGRLSGGYGDDYGGDDCGGASAPPPTTARSGGCYKCGSQGHWARDCPGTAGQRRGGDGQLGSCYKCGKPGHYASSCPGGGSSRNSGARRF